MTRVAATELLPALFRAEFSRMTASLCRRFGLADIALAEDIVSETFLIATEHWAQQGAPENPTAWLYTVAKRKAIEVFRRADRYAAKLTALAADQPEGAPEPDLDFSEPGIRDSQLRMLFAVCNPVIQSEAQIALALRILCGFTIEEIAEAFFSNKETINKRLFRAKEKLRAENIAFELPAPAEIPARLASVLRILYLLFNEGYYSRTHASALRRELCFEAMRLALTLLEYEPTNRPETNALLALMCFHASRFDAREGADSLPLLYEDQDDALWDRALMDRGARFLEASAAGDALTAYHLEAGIAWQHCSKADTPEKWRIILDHYERLLAIQYSPGADLNRLYALSRVAGKASALAELARREFPEDRFYHLLLAHLTEDLDRPRALECLHAALRLARSEGEAQIIRRKIDALDQSD